MRTYSHISRDTAVASFAAWDQGKFWEMHDLLFDQAPDLDREAIEALARKLNLDMDRFKKNMDDLAHIAELQQNLDMVHDLDIWSTPTVIINGLVIKGSQPIENYRKVIDGILGKSGAVGTFERLYGVLIDALGPAVVHAGDKIFGRGEVPLWVPAPILKPVNDLKVGEEAPDFTLPSTQGGTITLSDFRGRKNVLVSFLPAAFTPT